MRVVGFEPTQSEDNRFTVCPASPTAAHSQILAYGARNPSWIPLCFKENKETRAIAKLSFHHSVLLNRENIMCLLFILGLIPKPAAIIGTCASYKNLLVARLFKLTTTDL